MAVTLTGNKDTSYQPSKNIPSYGPGSRWTGYGMIDPGAGVARDNASTSPSTHLPDVMAALKQHFNPNRVAPSSANQESDYAEAGRKAYYEDSPSSGKVKAAVRRNLAIRGQ